MQVLNLGFEEASLPKRRRLVTPFSLQYQLIYRESVKSSGYYSSGLPSLSGCRDEIANIPENGRKLPDVEAGVTFLGNYLLLSAISLLN